MSKRDGFSMDHIRESMGDRSGSSHAPAGVGPRRELPPKLRGITRSNDVAQIELDRIIRDESQPREEFDAEALDRLAKSLRDRGQLQPIMVRWDENQGAYVVVVGERRFRAAQRAGLPSLACVILERAMSSEERLAVQLVENALREDLSPLESARAYKRLQVANGWSVRQLAEELAISPAHVAKTTALLELPAALQASVDQGAISPATGYVLSRVEDSDAQANLAAAAVAEGLSRDQIEERVKRIAPRKPSGSKGRGSKPKSKPLPTSATFKADGGGRVSIEHKKGLDPARVVEIIRDVLAQAESRMNPFEAA